MTTIVKRVPPRAQISASTIPPVQTAAPFPEPHFPRRTSLVHSLSVPLRTAHCTRGRVVSMHHDARDWQGATRRAKIDVEKRSRREWRAKGRTCRGLWRAPLVQSRGGERAGSVPPSRGKGFVVENEHRTEWGRHGERLTAGSFVSKVRIASLREASLRIFSYCVSDGSPNVFE